MNYPIPKWRLDEMRRIEVRNLTNVLDDDEKRLIAWRFGFDGDKGQGFIELGKKFGVTPKTIQKRIYVALAKMRKAKW